MSKDFIYTTYIKTTPEKVWQAITNPEFCRQYWGNENISDWKKGSDWKHVTLDSKEVRIIGKVLESTVPTRLVLSWVDPNDEKDTSKLEMNITTQGDLVRLDVVHTGLGEGMFSGISRGWPLVLSNMKTFLEGGTPFDIVAIKTCAKSAA